MTDYKIYSGKTVHIIYDNNEVYGKVMEVNCTNLYLKYFVSSNCRCRVPFDKIKLIEEINVKEDDK